MKTHYIIILPPMRGIPTGHILQIAVGDAGEVIKSRHDQITDKFEMNRIWHEAQLKGIEKGFEVTVWVDAQANYKVTTSKFRTDPLGAIMYLMSKNEEPTTEESPF